MADPKKESIANSTTVDTAVINNTIGKTQPFFARRPGNLGDFGTCIAKVANQPVFFLGCGVGFGHANPQYFAKLRIDIRPLFGKRPPGIRAGGLFRQARQDLNPQPVVLETAALPVELLA